MSKQVCPICGASILSNDVQHQHSHALCATYFKEGYPLSFTVSVQSHYNEPSRNAMVLAKARQELKQYFPNRKFEIQPGRLILRKDGENSCIMGEAYVATYLVFEI